MAVATQTKGRNLAPYLRLRRDDLEVLVARDLVPLAPTLRVSTRRWVTKGFHVDFPGAPACEI
ncbi:MAG TPA: hypothetical protein VLR27_04390 [Acidimicrobiales bacterium]|nr:hypothetical protein [Acidimicrobiales bacterium]